MYFNARTIRVRNLSVAVVNGIITLIILLIAPLGLAAVVINTALVTVATYFTAMGADWVVRYLQPQKIRAEMGGGGMSPEVGRLQQKRSESDLSHYD